MLLFYLRELWRLPSRQIRQDLAEEEHVFDNFCVCEQGSVHHLCTTWNLSQPQDPEHQVLLEICCRCESACLGSLDGSEAGPGFTTGHGNPWQSFPDVICFLGLRRCCHLLSVWTLAVSCRCMTWEDLGQTKPKMWAKKSTCSSVMESKNSVCTWICSHFHLPVCNDLLAAFPSDFPLSMS